MNRFLLVVALTGLSIGCGPSISEQCLELAEATCAWAYRCQGSGYSYIDMGTSEADCVARYGFSGAPGPGCQNVTSPSQACSAPRQFQSDKVEPCVAEMDAAACSSSGPLTGASCTGLCK